MRTLPYSPIFQWQQHLQMLFIKRNILQYEFSLHPLSNKSSQKSNNYRWQKYRQWVQQSYEHLNDQKHKLEQKYYEVNSRLNEATQLLNLSVLQEHDVIGLTTTCAAKLQPSLRALKAPIVLVEEAAEILESHIVCSMTKHCQQVILIGDHKQLKPKASVYELGKKYNLNVSLFERMVNIRGDCQQLTYQHRMRPQIAKLIRPAIYEKLYDHEIVLNYPDVMGLSNNVFFINHQNREHYNDNDDSCINDHEVKFLTAFAKHLVLQGYKPEEITILCTYTGQMFDFMNETKYHELLKKVRVTTVDNFQGEENKIILLSLVRNNGEGKIGFLKEENRVCVALSRAREGLYIMGNMDDLLVENDIWPQIKKVLEEDNAIGDSLAVKCQVHSDQIFQMTNAEDFVQCPEGGCMLKCDLLLSCGHNCTRVCHILDREHQKYCCRQPCNRTCPNNHPCSLLCEQPCQPCQVLVEKTLKCGHTGLTPCSADPDTFNCLVDVEVILPACNHKVTKCCYLPLSKCLCDYDCDIRLECGHRCARKCHISDDSDHAEYKCLKDCTKKNIKCSNDHMCKKRCHEECEPCSIHVTKTRSCGHYYKNIECSKDVESLYCSRPCKKGLLNCGHKCVLKCGDDCKNCQTKVEKESSCGHVIKVKCCEEATPALCDKKCPKMLPCGHPCTNMCKDNCTVACQVLVQVYKLGLCGHPAWLPCCMKQTDPKSPEFLKYCKEPCKNELACGHFCKGNCGQCLQGRLHVVCSEPCPRIFVCGHACKTLCNQECQPCNEPCKIRCGHSRCPKRCGMPCKPCQEPCELSCEHQSCSRKCHQYCSIKPCEQPCKKLLKCNHPCIGFCGDPCPPLCRICNFEEVTTIVFGKEDEPDAKFVLLSDCKHSIESKALMSSVINPTNSDGSVLIKALTCPICSTPISNCKRIMNNIRQNLNSIIILKKKFFGEDEKDYKKKQQLYINIVSTLLKDPKTNIPELSKLKNYMTHLKKICSPFQKSKKQILSSKEVCIFKSITDILNELVSLIKQIKQTNINIEFIIKQVNLIVESLPFTLSISKQRLEDINVELRRLHLMVKVYNLFSDGGLSSTNKTEFVQIIKKLTCFNRFTKTIEQDIIGMSATLIEENKKNLLIERKVITQAVTQAEGLKSGAWFKCPNGHFYAVGDCGGPTEERKCAECNEKIGGRNHTLTVGNKLATEIDGASRSAWPTTLNR